MTTSRSSIRRWVLVAAVLVLSAGAAFAGSRKRVVVLDFEGPHAEKFHNEIVKLLKKHHTVVPTDKWTGTADELGVTGTSGKDIKKVAHKLHVDGVIEGKIEKRRDEYIIRLKLHAGTNGEVVGDGVDTHSGKTKLDGAAKRDINDELVGAIDSLDPNHGGDDDDEVADAKPNKKKHGDDDSAGDSAGDSADDSDSGSHKHGFSKHAERGGDRVGGDDAGDDDSRSNKKKHGDDEARGDDDSAKHGDDDGESKKHHDGDDTASGDDGGDPGNDHGNHKKKRVASADDDDASAEASSSDQATPASVDALSPVNRGIDAALGLSFTARRLSFAYSSKLAGSQVPAGYKQSVPVAGGFADVTVYPMAISHKNKGILNDFGVEVMFDRVLRIASQKSYTDAGANKTATLATVSERYGLGGVFRYPLGKLAVGGRLMYQNQQFLIQQNLPNGMVGPINGTDIPNVHYSMFEVGGFARYVLNDKMAIDGDAGFLAVLSTGADKYDIGSSTYYGKATATAFEIIGGLDYMLTKNIFLRAEARVQIISLKFKSDMGTLANNRDTDPASQDVMSASDKYFGGMVTAGYAY